MNSPSTIREKHKLIDSWQLPNEGERLFSADFVIDAYFRGKDDGEQSVEQKVLVLRKQFEANLAEAAKNTAKVYEQLKVREMTPISAHLKTDTFDRFDILILVAEEDVLKDSFDDIYKMTRAMEVAVSEDGYNVSFSFINKSQNFDEDMLFSDGYIFTYGASENNQ